MSERGLPELAVEALRDHGSDARVERVWRRLESDLAVGTPRPRAAVWWAPAALVIVFGAGVFVGVHWQRQDVAAVAAVAVVAEPAPATEAAGQAQPPFLAPAPRQAEQPKRERKLPLLDLETPPEQAIVDSVVAVPEVLTTLPPVVTGPPEWQRLAHTGDYTGASRAVDKQGGFDLTLATASPEQLMTLYEMARSTRQMARAQQALRQVFERYPGDENAPLAAWTLANLLEQAHDKAGAAAAIEAYRRLSPRGDFAEDALNRQFEDAVERGNLQAARQYADQYAKDFPKGRRLAAINKQLAKLSGAPQAQSGPEGEDTVVEDEAEEVTPPPRP